MQLRLTGKIWLFLLIVFIADELHSQTIITAAGDRSGISGGDGGAFSQAGFAFPTNMLYDKAGNLYLTEYNSGSVRKVDRTTGIITTFFVTPSYTSAFGMAFNQQHSNGLLIRTKRRYDNERCYKCTSNKTMDRWLFR